MKQIQLLFLAIMMAMNANATITPTESQMWWGYISESDITNSTEGYLGFGSAVTIDAAIRVPANHPFVGSSTIKAVRIWLGTDLKKISGDVQLWIAKNLPDDISKAEYVQTVNLSDLKAGINDIELVTPFDVKNEGLYIGYSFYIKERAYPVVCGGKDVDGAFYYRVSSENQWYDFNGYEYGKLALQILIDGGTYPENCATLSDFGQHVVLKGKSVSVPVTIVNCGKNVIKKVSYTISTDGGNATSEKTINVGSLAYNGSIDVDIDFSSESEAKKCVKTITITKVNGVDNNYTENKASGNLITVTKKLVNVPVVEEFTGTWCGYCPYGMVGMEEVNKAYGDKVALIAVHSGDVMEIADYSPILYTVGSFPSAFMNREFSFYPYNFSQTVDQALKRTVQGAINVTAEWTNDAKTAINIKTETTFGYSDDNGQYGIAYVLVADGLKGSGSDWTQSNYLSGDSGDSNMSFWYNSPSKVTGVEFNHVAIAAWDIENGVEGSVNKSIKADEVQEYLFTANISSNKLVQDKSKLKVITLLIDKISGTVVNAAQTTINDPGTGISTVSESSSSKVAGYYTIDGKRIDAPVKGINIVRMSDGTSRKIVISK